MTASDHKRKSRPIAPAEVRCGDGWIEIVVPDVLGKNEALAVQDRRGHRHLSKTAKLYRESVQRGVNGWREAESYAAVAEGAMGHVCDSRIEEGAWRLEVLGVWPRENHTAGFKPCPKGDADAAVPQALDALQHAGILDNDARVVEVRAWNMYRKDVRCTVIRLVRVPDLAERDSAVAHLVEHVPPSPPPAPPAKRMPNRKLRGLTKPRKEPT